MLNVSSPAFASNFAVTVSASSCALTASRRAFSASLVIRSIFIFKAFTVATAAAHWDCRAAVGSDSLILLRSCATFSALCLSGGSFSAISCISASVSKISVFLSSSCFSIWATVAAAASSFPASAATGAALRSFSDSASRSAFGFPMLSRRFFASSICAVIPPYFSRSAFFTVSSSFCSLVRADFASCASLRNLQDAVSAIGHPLSVNSCAFFSAPSIWFFSRPMRTRLSPTNSDALFFKSAMVFTTASYSAIFGERLCRSVRTCSSSRTAASISAFCSSAAV